MKKLTCLFLFISFVSFSQGYDRTKYKTAKKTDNQAYKKLLNEDYYGAIALYNKVIESYGQTFQLRNAYEGRGKAKFELEDYKGAAADFTEYIKLEKTENPILFDLPYPADIKQTNLMIVYDAEDIVEFYLKRGYSKYKLGDKKGACEDSRKVQEFRNEFPNEIDITGYLNEYSVAQGHLDLIESACEEISITNKSKPKPLNNTTKDEVDELFASGQIKYDNGTQDLKELIVIQTLLAENRIDDLSDFIINNNYVSVNENTFYKLEQLNLRKKGEIFPIFSIEDLPTSMDNNTYSNKFIVVNFSNTIENWNSEEGIVSNFKHYYGLSKYECEKIFDIVTSVPKLGYPYLMFKGFKEFYDKDENYIVEQIDRYTLKVYDSKKGEETILQASNFYNSTEEITNGTNINFIGPGEVLTTQLRYRMDEEKESESGDLQYSVTLGILSFKADWPKDKMNVDFFMSLKNFNDRIWIDK